MGFYGNITNTARTQFAFDKKYPNRFEMEQKCAKDGVYTGRYILIEYDQNCSIDLYPNSFYRINDVLYRSWVRDSEGRLISTSKEDIIQTVISKEDILNAQKANQLYSGTIYRIEPGRHMYNINQTPIYIKVRELNTSNYIINYDTVTENDFIQYWGDSDIELENRKIFRINGLFEIPAAVTNIHQNTILVIPPGYQYSLNTLTEYVSPVTGSNSTTIVSYIHQEDGQEYFIYDIALWKTIAEIGDNTANLNTQQNFLINFQTDVAIYGTARGYDSTVWQKVYSNNQEKYVMISTV